MQALDIDIINQIVLILLGSSTVVQLYYILSGMSGPSFFKKMNTTTPSFSSPVSIVICARNELKNLRIFLPSILDQNYPEYQVVVVNDCSWDESSKYLEEMEDAYPQLKVVTLKEQEKYQHGKKFALTLGIKAATHEHLLLTDADCKPGSKNWIKSMVEGFSGGKEMVISYGAYTNEPGLLSKWIRFDTAMNAMLYLSRALKGKAYMGVGRNLAYTKSLFFKNKGFAKHYHIMSGDDDLFVNETSNKNNTSVVLNQEAFTYSKPKTSFYTWFWQKKRHMSTGKHYKGSDRTFIGAYFFSLFMFWMMVILAIVLKLNWQLIVGMIVIRLMTQMIICWKGFKALGEKDLVFLIPLFDIITAFLYPILAVSNIFIKTKSWK